MAQVQEPPPEIGSLKKIVQEDLSIITAPLLGIKFSVYDLSVIAATALLVLAIWQYYCVRRENQAVHAVCKEARLELTKGNVECARYLYYGIAHDFVFTTRFDTYVPAGVRARAGPTFVIALLFFAPAWIPLIIVATDLWSLLAACRICPDRSKSLLSVLGDLEAIEAFIRMTYAIALGGVSGYYCVQGMRLESGTRRDVDRLQNALDRKKRN